MEFEDSHRACLAAILRWRRDVRHFRRDPVDQALIARLRGAMDLAPSVGNSRPWRVILVQDSGIRSGVHDIFNRCNAAAATLYSDDQRDAYQRLKLAGLDAAPVHLAVFTATDPAAGHGLGRQTMAETLRQSTAMAVHCLWLAARAENLGMGMVSILDPRAMERLLTVPEDWEFSAYLCLGWPEFADDTPLLDRVGWQENTASSWEIR